MEQYTTATTTTGEQIVVQTANGQIQQQVSSVFSFKMLVLMRKYLLTIISTFFELLGYRDPDTEHSSGFDNQSVFPDHYLSAIVLSCLTCRHRAQ